MRQQIINAIHRRMATDPRVFFVIADVGINLVEPLARDYPDRFINVGIAEQNMIGVCAGLVNGGYRPICYTITNFAVHRCLEQVRDEIGLHKYPVIILGSTCGFENSTLGPTHHIIDDWGAMRAIHGIEIHCPSSVPYAEPLIDDLIERGVPAFIRIPKGEFKVPASADPFVHVAGRHHRVALATYGGLAQACLSAQENNRDIGVLVFNRLRPLDGENVARVLMLYNHVVVVEDHFAESGLYSSLCQIIAEQRLGTQISSRAPQAYSFEVGDSPEYFWRKFAADSESLTADFKTVKP